MSDNQGWFSRVFFGDTHNLNTRSGMYQEPLEPVADLPTTTGSVDSAGGDSPLPGIVPPARPTVPPVSVDIALGLSAVYRSVDIICTSVMQLELGVWRGTSEMKRVPGLVSRPDINSSPSKFLKKTTMSMATHGNAFWLVDRQDNNDPTSIATNLTVLNPLTVSIEYDAQGILRYRTVIGKKSVLLDAHRVKHLKLMEVWGQDLGLGPIQAQRIGLAGHVNLRDYSQKVFTEYPTGVVSSKDNLNPDVVDAYKDRWYEADANGARIKFLGNGMTYQPIMLNPEDAQFIENQAFAITDVARMFGIPANYLHAEIGGNSMTYQNMEDVDTQFVKYTLTGYLREIEEAFTDLLPRGQRARFKLEGFLRADEKTRAEVYKYYKEMGVLTPEEIRISEGWGEMPDELKEANKGPAPQSPNAAPPQSPITGDDGNE